jgi:ATP-dependent phosphofructokinase / diphosphate-dependent phosphofructokinase
MGLVEGARSGRLRHLWAARGGLGGIFRGEVTDLLALPSRQIARIAQQPGSIIGSFRGPISQSDLQNAVGYFRRRDVRYCFYTGGNGSMETAQQIAQAAREQGYELNTIGIPKTIDNDICETDHSPGFGSAARFVAVATRVTGLDQRALPTPVSIIEVMGRNTGWLAAASALARERASDPPHFVYVPERPFDEGEFLGRVDRLLRKVGWVVGVVAEGIRDAAGRPVAAAKGPNRDARGRPLVGNASAVLAALVSRRLRVRVRSEKPGLLCRAFSLCRSQVDAAEARAVGRFAVKAARDGKDSVMIALRRPEPGPYRVLLTTVPLHVVAGRERCLPGRYVPEDGAIHESFRPYAEPLIGTPLEPLIYIS